MSSLVSPGFHTSFCWSSPDFSWPSGRARKCLPLSCPLVPLKDRAPGIVNKIPTSNWKNGRFFEGNDSTFRILCQTFFRYLVGNQQHSHGNSPFCSGKCNQNELIFHFYVKFTGVYPEHFGKISPKVSSSNQTSRNFGCIGQICKQSSDTKGEHVIPYPKEMEAFWLWGDYICWVYLDLPSV